MFRIFGFAGAFVLAAAAELAVDFGVVVSDDEAPGALFVVAGAVPVPAVEPATVEPFAGVDVVGAVAGNVVSGVGTGGNGLATTPAIRSVKPTSESL